MAERVGFIRPIPETHPWSGQPAAVQNHSRWFCEPCGENLHPSTINIKGLYYKEYRPFILMAERVGFEPTKGYSPLLVFKTSAFSRSATSPKLFIERLELRCSIKRAILTESAVYDNASDGLFVSFSYFYCYWSASLINSTFEVKITKNIVEKARQLLYSTRTCWCGVEQSGSSSGS